MLDNISDLDRSVNVKRENQERGIAIFFAIFALLLLTAIGAALMFMASTETSINSNYRQEEIAYFAAKAGIEEARARMMQSDPNTLYVAPGDATHPLFDPSQIAPPTVSNHMIYYIVNPGSGGTVQPWNSTDPYADDELCHDGYTSLYTGLSPQMSVTAPDVRCTPGTLPSAAYVSYTSALPFSNSTSPIQFKWVRVSPKLNSSVPYLNSSGTIQYDSVNSTKNAATLICWDGQEEVPLASTAANCSLMFNASQAPLTNVYLVTAFGVSPSSARKVVQSEVALQPTAPFPYGMYATSTACPAITFSGNNPSTDSYTSANGGTYSSTHTSTGGDIGSNGSVSVGNGNIGGIIGVLQPSSQGGNGNCATPVTIGSQGSCENSGYVQCSASCPSGNSSQCYVTAPYTFPTPAITTTPNTSYSPPSCSGSHHSGNCMTPGTYGNISITGTLYLAPGSYNVNSLSMTGNAAIIVNPAGAVTLNIGGTGQSSALAIAGNGITDDSNPNDFTINYAGTGTVSVAGNGDVTAILNAPNANLTQQGNGNWYGSMVASVISIGGNAFFHYDTASAVATNNNGYFTMLSYREMPY